MIYVSRKTRRKRLAKMNVFVRFFALWRENLVAWAWYLEEHRLDSHLDIQHYISLFFIDFKDEISSLKLNLVHQVNANTSKQFPESDHWFSKMALFISGSFPRIGDHLKERILLRRKRQIQFERALHSRLDQMRLHPLQFLGYALAAVSFAYIVSIYTLGNIVTYKGQDMGVVNIGISVRGIISSLEEYSQVALADDSYTIDVKDISTEATIVPRREVENKDELTEKLSEAVGDISYAYVLYINDEPIAATKYSGALEELLEQLKQGYISEDTVDCYFEESVEIRQEYVQSSFVMNLGYIAEILNDTRESEITYTVKYGDSYFDIAENYGLTVDELLELNPGYNPNLLHVDDVLTISNAVSYLTVVHVERQRYLSDVPYEITYEYDDTMYQGDYTVLSPGTFGKADISANVTYINGAETLREIVSNVTLVDPITETQMTGTIPRPTWFPTGTFRWPCNGTLTSRFGGRNTGIRGASTYHEGIDLGNSYGTPIYASDGGTVSYSGWMGGYGYLVIIDHGNGYKTYYGHNSSLIVSVGDHVYQGQQIARMGSTGISSGNHCHFGIMVNNSFVNPMNYLS